MSPPVRGDRDPDTHFPRVSGDEPCRPPQELAATTIFPA